MQDSFNDVSCPTDDELKSAFSFINSEWLKESNGDPFGSMDASKGTITTDDIDSLLLLLNAAMQPYSSRWFVMSTDPGAFNTPIERAVYAFHAERRDPNQDEVTQMNNLMSLAREKLRLLEGGKSKMADIVKENSKPPNMNSEPVSANGNKARTFH